MAVSTDVNQLAEPLGSMVRYALASAARSGRSLTLVSGRRSAAQQIALRRAHCGTSHHAVYEMSASRCKPPTARPGTSKHETGNAADMGGAKDWMALKLRAFNVTRPVPGENWHFQYKGSNAAADLTKLYVRMESEGFTTEQIKAIIRVGPQVSGGRTFDEGFPNPITSPIEFAKAVASAAADAAGDAAGSAIGAIVPDEFQNVAKLFTTLIDPNFWRRVGLGAAGVSLLVVGGVIVTKDLSSGTLQKVAASLAKPEPDDDEDEDEPDDDESEAEDE